ncbi:PorP/SprF family type IX secretion system membrane protein [Flavobacterium gawalongense]|uniref:Type IX secretion system membrane protein PorP/SprF n=1 Tax=Flavobacterium gawalongense TaxID=2594432 RepID=A0A553BHZ3_9FLAO|nr:PorP/SprF family type IX secretion system membrane protein [Flavobacterium gawalongense]TRX07360.1 type IX secretion system membrane protein PorP/SprF [Flavobacterium gawalongense]TRX07876.1 type IX secretion system membrane protein PorP/SprF [Flavobacterium gawalongense]TRX23323.1 type IX secretion system membrane protein PorP/SprF [Flavobacterium gawalongense]
MKNIFLVIVFFFCIQQMLYSQEDGVVSFTLPVRNSLKFNKFLINPTFSFVREQSTIVSFYNKRQWIQFDDAPQTYLFSYSGRFRENEGIAVGLFQQNYGVLTTFGAVANFAHNVVLEEDSNLTFGMNVGFYKSGLNKTKVVTNYPDPSLENIPSNALITVNPGINYGTAFLDFGLSVNNLILYNLKTSKTVEDDPEKSIEAHIMHTGYLDTYGFFDKSKFSALVKTAFKKDKTVISGLMMFAIPKGIWAQAGYNTVYGISGGIGLNITPKISLEYNFEKGMGSLSNFGSSHEIVFAYKFKSNNYYYGDDEEEGSIVPAAETRKSVPAKPKESAILSPVDAQRLKELKLALVAEKEEIRLFKLKEIADAKAKLAADIKAKLDADAAAKTKLATTAKSEALTQAKLAADAKAKADALAQAKLVADAKPKSDALAKAKLAADSKAKSNTLAQAKLAADAKAKADALAQAKLAADAKAKADALAQAKLVADAKTKADALAQAKLAADAKTKADSLAQAKLAADAKAKADALAQAKSDADAKTKANALAQAKLAADAKAKADALAQAKLAADAKIKADALAQAKLAADAKAKADALAQSKLAADAKTKADSLAQAKLDADAKTKADALAQAKLDADAKVKADVLAQAKLAADAKVKADVLAQAKLAADAKTKADALAQAKLDADAKVKADVLAQAKLAADAKVKADVLAQAKLAADAKAKADSLAQAKLAADAKTKADSLAQAKLAADAKAKADALAQSKLAADAKTKADSLAQAKLDADAKAKADALAQAKLAAETKAKADALAQEKLVTDAKVKADALTQEKLAADAKAKADALSQAKLADMPKDDNAKSMDNLAKLVGDSKNIQQQLLTKFNVMVANKERDLKDLKEENDLSEKGIFKEPKAFKSVSAENSALESLKSELAGLNRSQSEKIIELDNLYKERLKKRSDKNDASSQYYLKTVETLKAEQLKTEQSNLILISSLEKIKADTEIEKKRRIKRAAFENDQGRYLQDKATLNRIREKTPFSTVPLKAEDFDYGDEQSNMQILKNIKNVESGYYLIVAVHNDVAKRDGFLTKSVAAGQSNIDFFYDVNTSKYFIYYDKFDTIEDAKKALKSKGNKPYNSKLSIVKIEN